MENITGNVIRVATKEKKEKRFVLFFNCEPALTSFVTTTRPNQRKLANCNNQIYLKQSLGTRHILFHITHAFHIFIPYFNHISQYVTRHDTVIVYAGA
jgi:hypothetical protein